MKFNVDPKIFEKFPGVEIGVLVITEMDNKGRNEEILKLLRAEEKRQKELLGGIELGSLPEVSVWRKIYKDFGSNPRDFNSSVEALLRRARGGEKPLPQINNLVDLYNYLSIKYHLPAGSEDLDKVVGDIELAFAKGTEKGKYIGGEDEDTCYEGEVIYKDKAGFICRRWNWREADRTKIDFDTENCVLVIENAPGLDKENFQKALAEAEELVAKLLSRRTQSFILTAESNFFEISFKSGSKSHPIQDRKAKTILDRQPKKSKPVPHQPAFFSQIRWEGEDSISFRLKKLIFEALREVQPQAVKDLEISDIILEHPNSENYGDYSTNLAMKLSGKLKMNLPASEFARKRSRAGPVDLAKKLKDKLDVYIIKHQSRSSGGFSGILEKVEVAPPGFLNLWLHTPSLITELIEVLNDKESVLTTYSNILTGKKISVEYTDPNPFKEFHLGHMYSNFIGETISRMFEASGAEVWRADYYGDVGMHVAKSVWGMMKKMEEEKKSLSELDKLTIPQRQNFLGQGYALGVKKYEEDPKSQQEIKDLNLLLYVAGQEILKKTKNWKPLINYRQYVKGSLDSLPELLKVYEAGLRWSLEYFETIYKRLGTKFDGYYPESWVGEYGIKLVEEGLKQGIMEKSDGSVIFRGENYGLHTRVFVNKLGLPTYEAKELGLAPAKYEEFKYDLSVIVTGNEIKEYFFVLLTVLRKIAPELGEKTLNVSHGMVKLPEGKMSSRTGNVITFARLLEEAKSYALKIMKNADFPVNEKQKVAETVGLAAVRYALLKSNIGIDVTFDFDKSVSFEGDSGPYLLYTYARCRSVIRKWEMGSGKVDKEVGNGKNDLTSHFKNLASNFSLLTSSLNPEELSLLRTLYRFPEVLAEATRTLSPNLICTFLFDLAQKYNLFYNKHSILGKVISRQSLVVSNDQSSKTSDQQLTTNLRLFLTHATSQIIKKGLYLLGIETVERM